MRQLRDKYSIEKDEHQRKFLFRENVEYGGKNFAVDFKQCRSSEEIAWKMLQKRTDYGNSSKKTSIK